MATRNSGRLTDHGFVAHPKKHQYRTTNFAHSNLVNNVGKQQRVPLGQISGATSFSHLHSTFRKQDSFQIWNDEAHKTQDENSFSSKNDSQMSISMEMSHSSTASAMNISIDMSSSQDSSLIFEDAPTSVVMKSPIKKHVVQEASESVYMTAQSQLSSSLYSTEDFYSCPAFAEDIFKYLRNREMMFRPRLSYMQKQSEITVQMRAILVDWFIDVINEYNLHRATLFLTVTILDRTLSYLDCPRLKLQLLGASSVMLASKYEEIYPPEVKDMVYITDDSYTKDQVIRMEKIILKVLEFNLSPPTAQTFASMMIARVNLTPQATSLVWYLLELSLMHFDMLVYRPSELAAAAVMLSAFVVDRKRVNYVMEEIFAMRIQSLKVPMADLLRIFHQAPSDNLTAIFSKYSEPKYFSVSSLTLPTIVPKEVLECCH